MGYSIRIYASLKAMQSAAKLYKQVQFMESVSSTCVQKSCKLYQVLNTRRKDVILLWYFGRTSPRPSCLNKERSYI